jgi:hypothetical protein
MTGSGLEPPVCEQTRPMSAAPGCASSTGRREIAASRDVEYAINFSDLVLDLEESLKKRDTGMIHRNFPEPSIAIRGAKRSEGLPPDSTHLLGIREDRLQVGSDRRETWHPIGWGAPRRSCD